MLYEGFIKQISEHISFALIITSTVIQQILGTEERKKERKKERKNNHGYIIAPIVFETCI